MLLSTQYLTPEEELALETDAGQSGNARSSISASMGTLFRGAINRLSAVDTTSSPMCSAADSDSLNRSEPSTLLRVAASKKRPQSLALAVDGASLEAIWSDTVVKVSDCAIALLRMSFRIV